MSKRKYDINGWYEVKNNPLSKVGVFPYTGAMIDPNGEFGLDPDKIYNVMRPKDELSDPETIESFKLVPWINEHIMLGKKNEGLTPAEEKGINGVIGENVFFDDKDQTLKGNVKIFAESLKDDIEKGKRELSLGYRCKYEKKSGVFNGQSYDFVQKCIRGNHMASVYEGRMGSEVAVLDGNLLTFTIDSKEFRKMAMTPEEMEKVLLELMGTVTSLTEKIDGLSLAVEDACGIKSTKDAEPKEPAKDAEPTESEKDAEPKEPAKDAEPKEPKKDSEGMDSLILSNKELLEQVKDLTATVDSLKKDGTKTIMSEISKRNSLAKKVSFHVGTFDYSEMTLKEVAEYAADKLGLKCEKGTELATLNGFLHDRNFVANALDSKLTGEKMNGLDDYINGKNN